MQRLYDPMSVDVSLGNLSPDQGSNQTAYASGSAGQHPNVHLHLRWQSARCKYPRCTSDRTRCLLRNGPWLSGLCQTLRHISSSRLLCDPLKIQSQMPKNLFSSDRPCNGSSVRPDNYADGILFAQRLSDKLRRIKYYDADTDKTLIFLTNNFALPALTIAQLYRCRWQVELFFKWIKQNLRIKNFYGTSENAVKTQIWIAVSVYVLVAILKKRLNIPASLYTILQILSVSVFERIPLLQLLTETALADGNLRFPKPVEFIHLTVGHYCEIYIFSIYSFSQTLIIMIPFTHLLPVTFPAIFP